jgi:hypothetical protein
MTIYEVIKFKKYTKDKLLVTKKDALLLIDICEKGLQEVEKVSSEEELREFLRKYEELLDDDNFKVISVGE